MPTSNATGALSPPHDTCVACYGRRVRADARRFRNPPGGAHAYPMTAAITAPVVPHVRLVAQVERIVFRVYGGENFHADAFFVDGRAP